MTREYLKGLGLTDEQINSVMGENGKDIEAAKGSLATVQQQLATAQTEISGLKGQLADRDKDIEELKKQVGDNTALSDQIKTLQSKYDTDTKALQERLDSQAYSHAADKFFDGFKFSSKAARKAALSDFTAKKLKLVDGKFEGADEFMASLKKDDPTMFASDETDGKDGKGGTGTGTGGTGADGGTGKQPPQFTTGTQNNGGGGNGGVQSPFDFGFTSVRTTKTN